MAYATVLNPFDLKVVRPTCPNPEYFQVIEVLRKLPNFSLLLLPTTNPTCGEVAESSHVGREPFRNPNPVPHP